MAAGERGVVGEHYLEQCFDRMAHIMSDHVSANGSTELDFSVGVLKW